MAEPWSDGDVLTAADLAGLPWGAPAYDNGQTSDQTGIGSSSTDITGLSVTFTADSSRLYLVILQVNVRQVTSGGTATVEITDGSNNVKQNGLATLATDDYITLTLIELLTSASGSVTRKGRAKTDAGTLTIAANATSVARLIVIDVAAG